MQRLRCGGHEPLNVAVLPDEVTAVAVIEGFDPLGLSGPGYGNVAAFALLIAILLLRPTGLFGKSEEARA